MTPEPKINASLGMTCGCFDLLHAGHVAYLRECKKYCRELVVLIDSDENVKKLKGPERPIIPEDQRLFLVSSLDFVDRTVLFHSYQGKSDIIDQERPAFWFKSKPYCLSKVQERQQVEDYGGKVIIVPMEYKVSTTDIIQKILESNSQG
jgi:rfaE bifunctional protein nucleotidyltransferase chain/domain